MSFLERLKNMLRAPGGNDARSYWVHTRCLRCGEVISARVDLFNDLSKDFDTGRYTVHKVLVGDGRHRCFQRIEINLVFDKNKKLIDQSISGGEFLRPDEVEAAREAYERAMAEAAARAEAERQARAARAAKNEENRKTGFPNPDKLEPKS